MKLALRILVADRRGASAVPALLDLLRRHRAEASFVAPPRWLTALRETVAAGHEAGLLAFAAPSWWAHRRTTAPVRLETHGQAALTAFAGIFGTPPRLHAGAEAWMTPHALRLTQRWGFAYASDTRGRHPFVPVWNGEILRCPQIPTTLPTLGELADGSGAEPQALLGKLLPLTAGVTEHQVFTLRAGPDIAARPEPLEELLTGWREQGHEVVSIQALAAALDVDKLPRHEIIVGRVPGCSDTLLLQGEEFLSAWRQPA